MATEVGRGNRGGGGAGHANRGGGRQPGRGNGRGGDRSKFSWKRDEGSGHTNSKSSTIMPASEGASRWDEAAAPKHRDQDGGIWVQKAKESSESGGISTGHQSASPRRHIHGIQNPAQV
ncbi:RNA-binding protein FUS-like [Triticum dicoccoides]|uniref:RNA-binding protein FUS-like n=1 Tax=Triticum dicoccoides TaxID=85692 RepID=UPI00188DDBCA|nr:RNA-binding protein FUS-like [Triticum dicoccoides]